MSLIERGAEAYARHHDFCGYDSYEEMDAEDRSAAREVARVILEAACPEAVSLTDEERTRIMEWWLQQRYETTPLDQVILRKLVRVRG